jgi:hypothetical protein
MPRQASQAGNNQWKPASTTRDIQIKKAPQVFTFPDKTFPWRPKRKPIQLWADLPSGAQIRYEIIDRREDFPPCQLDGTSIIVDTLTVPANCDVIAIQAGSHPDYVDAPPTQANLRIVDPQWDWSYDAPTHSWETDGSTVNVTVTEKTGTTTRLSVLLFDEPGPCSHVETTANAARTKYTITLKFTGPGTCQFEVLGNPPDFSPGPLGGITVKAIVGP